MLTDVSKVSQLCQQLIDSAADVFGPQCLELFGEVSPLDPVETAPPFGVSTDDESTFCFGRLFRLLVCFCEIFGIHIHIHIFHPYIRLKEL